MDTVAIIPTRGGSKSIPRKNITLLAGRPLISYTIRTALDSESIDRVGVSTDEEEIQDVAWLEWAEVPYLRPVSLGKDSTPMFPVIQDLLKFLATNSRFRPSIVLLLIPTSPSRTAKHIDESVPY